MLTKLRIRNFKLFEDVEIELGERVVFVGPNNAGKTSALQALALWNAGVRRWVEKHGAGNIPKARPGVTLNRRDLIALPVPIANLLWRDLRVREGYREDGKPKTRNVPVEIDVEGVDAGQTWSTGLEFDYANEESFYCRSRLGDDGQRLEVPVAAAEVRLAYLPPMSGLAASETRLDEGAIQVRVGEGRTAEVLRNLCWQALQREGDAWPRIVERMKALFGVTLDEPQYVRERGEIDMTFRTARGTSFPRERNARASSFAPCTSTTPRGMSPPHGVASRVRYSMVIGAVFAGASASNESSSSIGPAPATVGAFPFSPTAGSVMTTWYGFDWPESISPYWARTTSGPTVAPVRNAVRIGSIEDRYQVVSEPSMVTKSPITGSSFDPPSTQASVSSDQSKLSENSLTGIDDAPTWSVASRNVSGRISAG